jgi:hypothetical protein
MGLRTLVRTGHGSIFAACLALALATAAFASTARAQNAEEIVTKLNGDALEAFNALDINKAGAMLEEALRVSAQGGVSPQLVARTNMNMGIIYVSGLSDHEGALPFFLAAVCTDPAIQLDPLTSTPEVQSVYAVALQKAQGGGCPQGASGGGAATPNVPIAPVRPPPDQAIIHHSPLEQLVQTPLPLYAEVHALAGAKKIFIFYKGQGMEQWKRVPMYQYQSGFAYQISCNDVWEPKVAYYIEAQDAAGAVVGVAGSAAQPIEVPVVTARTQAEPALPGAQSPSSCVASECPPGVKGCKKSGTAAIADACESDSDCQSGLACNEDDSVCMIAGAGSTEVPEYDEETGQLEDFDEPESKEPKRWFLQLGVAAGFSYLWRGMEADRPAPRNRVFYAENNPTQPLADPVMHLSNSATAAIPIYFAEPNAGMDNLLTAWVPDGDSEDTLGELGGECSADGTVTGPESFRAAQAANPTGDNSAALFPSSYCVRMKSQGFVPQVALRANVGYFITPRFAASGLFRFQFASGEGTLAGILLGARAEYLFSEPRATGLLLSGFGGLTFGQIQAQPPSDDSDNAPYAVTGPLGVHVGSTIRYRIVPNFGLFAAPEIDLQMIAWMVHIDGTLGVEAAF